MKEYIRTKHPVHQLFWDALSGKAADEARVKELAKQCNKDEIDELIKDLDELHDDLIERAYLLDTHLVELYWIPDEPVKSEEVL